jgi:enoyl-CoA hydratase
MTMIMYQDYYRILFDRPAPGVLRLTLNRPERMNALDEAGHRELAYVWPEIDKDPSVRAVILTGAGKAFSAGGDFEEVEKAAANHHDRVRIWREARDLVYNIINCSKPIVSALHGPVVGAGLVAALLADISIAAKDARIVDGHTRLGVAAGDHAAMLWPLLCGMAKAKYMLLLCEPIDGETADRIGLVSLSVDASELQERALAVASKLAASSAEAVQLTKHALNNWLRQAGPIFDASLALEMIGFGGPDVREGLASFREKRAPRFHNVPEAGNHEP